MDYGLTVGLGQFAECSPFLETHQAQTDLLVAQTIFPHYLIGGHEYLCIYTLLFTY